MSSNYERNSRGIAPERRASDTSLPSYGESVARSSSVSLAFSRFSLSRNRVSDAPEDTWGPHGLRLLYSAPEPLVDIIFVHGLRGGSVKTWCKDEDLRLFWPKAWIPREPDLQDVRIQSFGYNADWANSKETSLDIHDFGRSLFGEMTTSPYLRRHKDTPIIMVGHSMGGLVIKKAFLLAQQDHRFKDLADRIRCMFFLATPHRGCDSAKTLNTVLRASTVLSGREYIHELTRNSTSLQVISDEFRSFADNLQIWSFYETQKTKIGATSSVFVVDRDSAVLGYRNETAQPVNADHRNICKFDGPFDPNYLVVKNSLSKAVEDLLGNVLTQKADETRTHLDRLETYLNIAHSPEDDLHNLESMKADNSCSWVTELDAFQKWRDAQNEHGQAFWLTGVLGSGKSMATGHVIRHLQSLGFDVSYYFLKHSRKEQRTISGMLRNLAYQMAIANSVIRQRLCLMEENGVPFDKDDERAIWRKIFVNEIFKVPLSSQQFWVIDGLDECQDAIKIFPLISRLDPAFMVNLYFSSRRLPSFEKGFSSLKDRLLSHEMDIQDTLQDINSYIADRLESLEIVVDRPHESISKMVTKANGSFLWTRLAFEELEQVYSEDSIDDVLDEIPEGMTALYHRILESMEKNTREANITKAILAWTVCGVRNLRVPELQVALKLDLRSNIPNMQRTVEGLCGQLIRIDKNGVIQLVHSTARDFLLDRTLESTLAVRGTDTQGRLAKVCLEYLCSTELRPPRGRALISHLKEVQSPFADYAVTCWSEHLYSASSSDDSLLGLVYRFFKTNVLTWIEIVASRKKNLYFLTRAAKNMQNYLDRRAKYTSPLGPEYAALSGWATDLVRLTAKFGRNLINDPSAIHYIIPPFCPTSSRVYMHADASRGLMSVSGFQNTSWDDCICCLEHRGTRATSLAGTDNMFVIGLRSGHAKLFHGATCQEKCSVLHGELIRLTEFDNSGSRLVTSGNRTMKMWTVDGDLLWSLDHTDPPVKIRFSQNDDTVAIVTKSSTAFHLSPLDGSMVSVDAYSYDGIEKRQLRQFSRQAILSCSISPDLRVLAMAYRGRPLQLWSLENDVLLGACEKEALSISEALFNPNPEVEMVAVTYQDGELTLFDIWSQYELASVAGEAYTMVCTPDGRTLATGDMVGTIKLWDFETLSLLYCIRSPDYEVKSLAFSGDGLRLFDIRDQKTKVWEPAALVRKSINDDSSISDSLAGHEPVTVGSYAEIIEITVMLVASDTILVGKDDGTISTYDGSTGDICNVIYSHKRHVLPTRMSWNQSCSLLATADASSVVQVWRLSGSTSKGNTLEAISKVKEIRANSAIHDISISPYGSFLMIQDQDMINIHSLEEKDTTSCWELPLTDTMEPADVWCRWLKTAENGPELLLSIDHDADFNSHQIGIDGALLTTKIHIDLLDHMNLLIKGRIKEVYLDSSEPFMVVELTASNEGPSPPGLLVFRTADLREACKGEVEETPQSGLKPIAWLPKPQARMLLGFYQNSLVFLDDELWVRTLGLASLLKEKAAATHVLSYNDSLRHFLIPYEVIGGSQGLQGMVTHTGNVVFPRVGELVVIRDGLKWKF
ncbi:NACHT and WD domain protein [Apiospora sp. TS-2023a]